VRVFRSRVDPGSHELIVMLEYQPNDLGVFTYARGYKVKVTSGTDFVAQADARTAVHAVITERAGWRAQLDRRPEVEYFVTYPDGEPEPVAATP
jgi:hypothetical protein